MALVRSDGRELVGELFRLRRSGRQVRIGPLRVEKAGPRAAWPASRGEWLPATITDLVFAGPYRAGDFPRALAVEEGASASVTGMRCLGPVSNAADVAGSLVLEDLVVVEIKSVEVLLPVHKTQVITHLRLSGKPAGLLINFNVPRLMEGVKRVLNTR